MDEARFVLKCFLFAALLLMFSQLKTKDGTIETEVQAALVSSQTAHLVNKIAEGGVRAVHDIAGFIKNKVSGTQSSPDRAAANIIGEKLEAAQVDTKAALKNIESKVKAQTDVLDDDDAIEEIQ